MGKAEIKTEVRDTLETSWVLSRPSALYLPSKLLTLGPSGTV